MKSPFSQSALFRFMTTALFRQSYTHEPMLDVLGCRCSMLTGNPPESIGRSGQRSLFAPTPVVILVDIGSQRLTVCSTKVRNSRNSIPVGKWADVPDHRSFAGKERPAENAPSPAQARGADSRTGIGVERGRRPSRRDRESLRAEKNGCDARHLVRQSSSSKASSRPHTSLGWVTPPEHDPQTLPGPVPEPSVWALLIVESGFVGGAVRRHERPSALAT